MLFDLKHVKLLGSEDGAGSGDSNPANESLCGDLVVLHGVDADESTCAAEAGLAMDGDTTSVGVFEVALGTVHELCYDWVGGCGAIGEDHILVGDALRDEGGAIVFWFVQAHDSVNIQVLEDVDITGSGVTVAMDGITLVNGTHEGQELAWDNPVKITVLDLLVMFVFASVEILEIVPSKSDGMLKTLKAMKNGALVLAGATAGISVGVKVGVVLLEKLEGWLGVHLEDDHLEGAHQIGRVGQLGEVSGARVVIDASWTLEAVRFEQFLELTAETMRHG